jgi:hypothetical protein
MRCGPIIRAAGGFGNQSYYFLLLTQGSPDHADLYYVSYTSFVATVVELGTVNLSSNLAAGDVFALQASGSGPTVTLTAFRNGTQILQVTDSSGTRITAAGSAGIYSFQSSGATGTNIIRTIWAGAIGGPSESVNPGSATIQWSATQSFSGVGVLPNESIGWTAASGSVNPASGPGTTYTAPASGSADTITWTSVDLPTHGASVSITLLDPPPPPPPAPTNNKKSRNGASRRRGRAVLDFPLRREDR